MKNHRLSLAVFSVLIISFMMGSCHRSAKTELTDDTRKVYVKRTEQGYELIRNQNPFYLKGAGGNIDLALLAEMGANTIRLYDTTDVAQLLDKAHQHNLAVIVDIAIPKYREEYYANPEKNKVLINNALELVKRHKNHPALLMWNLGNELYYPFSVRKNNFIKTFNEIVDRIHEEDPDHPVSTAMAGVGRMSAAGIYLHSPQLDLLGINLFGDMPNLYRKLNHLFMLFGKKPYYISEFGSDGPWEANETLWKVPLESNSYQKAMQIRQRHQIIEDNRYNSCLGSLAFYWGNKLEQTYTWFSLIMDGSKSEIIAELENLWKQPPVKNNLLEIEKMLLDGKTGGENIVLPPNEVQSSNVGIRGENIDSLTFRWRIYPEAWAWAWSSRQINSTLIFNPQDTIDSFIRYEGNTSSFISPREEGPYRIFVFIYNKEGYFASANVPFYVLNQNENL